MIQLLMTSYFVFSSIYGTSTVAVTNDSTSTASIVPLTQIEEGSTTTIPTKKEVEKLVKQYFKDDPILVEIARCESEFRQYNEDGEILTGKVNKSDIGVMQINRYYHADKAEELGYDLKTVGGNMAYAQYLYDHEGVKPWSSSSPCWKGALKKIQKNQVALK